MGLPELEEFLKPDKLKGNRSPNIFYNFFFIFIFYFFIFAVTFLV